MALESVMQYFKTAAEGVTNNLFVAAIILLVGFVIGKAAYRLTRRGLKVLDLNRILRETAGVRLSVEEIISYFVLYFIYFISFVMALRHIGIATGILNLISALVIILIAIFFILSVKDFIPNMISGILIHHKRLVKEGDIVEMNGIKGKVTEANLLETRLVTKAGDIIIVPNANLTKNEIIKRKRF